jgi:hypothetical protein
MSASRLVAIELLGSISSTFISASSAPSDWPRIFATTPSSSRAVTDVGDFFRIAAATAWALSRSPCCISHSANARAVVSLSGSAA